MIAQGGEYRSSTGKNREVTSETQAESEKRQVFFQEVFAPAFRQNLEELAEDVVFFMVGSSAQGAALPHSDIDVTFRASKNHAIIQNIFAKTVRELKMAGILEYPLELHSPSTLIGNLIVRERMKHPQEAP